MILSNLIEKEKDKKKRKKLEEQFELQKKVYPGYIPLIKSKNKELEKKVRIGVKMKRLTKKQLKTFMSHQKFQSFTEERYKDIEM